MSLVPERLLGAFAQWAETEENRAFCLRINVLPLSRGVAQQKYKERLEFFIITLPESFRFKVY